MEPLSFLLGIAAFNVAVQFKKPIRKIAVTATSQAMIMAEKTKSIAYGIKEEIEDIVAEAHYEKMKQNMEMVNELHQEFEQHHTEH